MTTSFWWYELGQTVLMLLMAGAMLLHLGDRNAHHYGTTGTTGERPRPNND